MASGAGAIAWATGALALPQPASRPVASRTALPAENDLMRIDLHRLRPLITKAISPTLNDQLLRPPDRVSDGLESRGRSALAIISPAGGDAMDDQVPHARR